MSRHIGTPLHILQSIPSTNTYALAQYKKGEASPGALFLAHEQTQGRGQRNHIWETAAGKNLTFSFIIDISFLDSKNLFPLMACTALSCQKYIQQKIPEKTIHIKWINDIYVNTKKISGILIDTLFQNDNKKIAVVGIGININQIVFPPTLNATSLQSESGKSYDILTELHTFLPIFNTYFQHLLNGKTDLLHREYNAVLYKKNAEILLEKDGKLLQATLNEVSPNGNLVTTISGVIHHFSFGNITWVKSKSNEA